MLRVPPIDPVISANALRPLLLLTDAWGGRGGIARFNVELLTALSTYPGLIESVVLLRKTPRFLGAEVLPSNLAWKREACAGKWHYLHAVRQVVAYPSPGASHRNFNLIICGHIHLLPAAWLALAAARKRSEATEGRLMLILHGVEVWRGANLFACLFLNIINVLVSVSKFTKARFLSTLGLASPLRRAPSFILPNCTDLLHFTPGPKSTSLLERYQLRGRRVLLTLARLETAERYKGVDQILEVLPRLKQEIPGLCYLVAGEGSDKTRLIGKARSLGLSASTDSKNGRTADVLFLGWIPEEDKLEHYRLADAFLMPGWGEGFGIVYIEALACGIPVLGSKLDASRETLEGTESAFLADPRDPMDLLRGIRRALTAARGHVPENLQRFSRENFQRRVHTILDSLGNPPILAEPLDLQPWPLSDRGTTHR